MSCGVRIRSLGYAGLQVLSRCRSRVKLYCETALSSRTRGGRPVHRPCILNTFTSRGPIDHGRRLRLRGALKMGEKLCKIKRELGSRPMPDVVITPDTSRPIALQCAYSLDSVYREGFIKNRYIGRTFIMPGQDMRRKGVRMKLNTIKSEFAGRTVLLIDDSIVRGTTSESWCTVAQAGAKNVHFVSASPSPLPGRLRY